MFVKHALVGAVVLLFLLGSVLAYIIYVLVAGTCFRVANYHSSLHAVAETMLRVARLHPAHPQRGGIP